MSWVQLEHQIWNQLKKNGLNGKTFILAVSGGLDSMVLLKVFERLNLKTQVVVAHFHHGECDDQDINSYRTRALELVKKSCRSFQFFTDRCRVQLGSEAQFRKARRSFINSVLKRFPGAIVVTAHHQNDWLETLLLKLMRGSGVLGLKNFVEFNGRVFRPFLHLQKKQLKQYATEFSVEWLEDPSNQDTSYLRNWLRQDLMPRVEERHNGALRNMQISLERLVDPVQDVDPSHLKTKLKKDGCVIEIDRLWYKQLSSTDRETVVFLALKQAQNQIFEKDTKNQVSNQDGILPFWDITKGRVKEIIKRLDKNQKDIKFKVGPLKALTSSEKIVLEFKV